MTNVDRLLYAYAAGHHWNPAFPSLRNLDAAAVRKMDGSERDAKDLLGSWQAFDGNVAKLVAAFHKRDLQPDGEPGPATDAVMRMARCPMPDYAPPPDASFDYGHEELNAAVRSYQEYKANAAYVGGTGSWPKGCDPNVPNFHSARANVMLGGASAHQKATWDECRKMVEACMAEYGHSIRHVMEGDPKNAEHDVRFQSIAGSVIGFAYFPTPNTCQQTVAARIDNTFNPRATILAELYVHEYQGHSIGLEHTRGGIMNPSIGSPTMPPSWKGTPSESTVRRYFGGVALPPVTPPDPPTPPTGDPSLIFRGSFEAFRNGQSLGEFILTPKPKV